MPVPDNAAGEDARWLSGQRDTDLAQHVAAGWDLILAGFPAHSSVAVDLRVYSAGLTRVRGIAPAPCIHVVSLLSAGPDAGGPPAGACVGAFVSARAGETVVVAYDDRAATLRTKVATDGGTVAAEGSGGETGEGEGKTVGERGVAVYSLPHARAWARLSDCVTTGNLQAAGGVSLGDAVIAEDEILPDVGSATGERDRDGPASLRFTALPRMRTAAGMSAAEVTAFNMDRTAYVTWLVAARYGGRAGRGGLLGEAQLAFAAFVLLRGVGALTHWAALTRELCSACDGLVADAPEIAAAAARMLAAQMELVEAEVVAADGDGLREAVLNFCAAGRAIEDLRELAEVVRSRFGWNTGEEHC
jgi:AAR2 protein